MENFNTYSTPEMMTVLGRRFREYRILNHLTQKDVAEWTGLNIATVHKFESGKGKSISLTSFFLMLRCLRLADNLDKVLPELPETPYTYHDNGQKRERYRKKEER